MAGRSQLTGPVGVDDRLDIPQIISAANHRWLRPDEICEILQNHKMFRMCPEPENMPPSGSLFLFNRKEQKHFRKDGRNWKKKKDGKTVMEGNEKLKLEVGGENVLHCYYTRGEENKYFHRRIYRMLEKDLSHIVLVHYLEVKVVVPDSRTKEYRNTVESENKVDKSRVPLQARLDSYMPRPYHDQLFSIVDLAPNCGYENSETKVLITGRFLNGQHSESCKWLCMFGEVEVSAEVIGDGVLRCYAPAQKAGRVSFFVTCSNRLACSEVKEFEYRADYSKYYCRDNSDETLNLRFEKLLSSSSTSPNCDPTSIAKNFKLSGKTSSLLKYDNDECDKVQQCLSDHNFSWGRVLNEQSLQPLKEKLYAWLLQKLDAGGKGPSVLDEGGQGVLHLAAALGYDWALWPMKIAGVSVDFRDVNGWTALHWAAFCGREGTVAVLIILGADPRALTDSNPPSKEPADLAFEEGHFDCIKHLVKSSVLKFGRPSLLGGA